MNDILNSTLVCVLFFTHKDCLLRFDRICHLLISVTLSFEERRVILSREMKIMGDQIKVFDIEWL